MNVEQDLEVLDEMRDQLEGVDAILRQVSAHVSALQSCIAAALERHRPYTDGEPSCHECGKAWPCPTVADLGCGL